jgi:16S rRNA (guanine527-N7)-methyltransferase
VRSDHAGEPDSTVPGIGGKPFGQQLAFHSEEIPRGTRIRLESFVALLSEWNRSYNLVGAREWPRLWPRHVYDSLALWPLIEGREVVDIGSGAGFPGLVLALADRDRSYCLIESNRKKALFLNHAKRQLGIDNLEIRNLRAERLSRKPRDGPATLMSRAIGPLPYFLEVTASWCDRGDQWLAMKGEWPPSEGLTPGAPWHVAAVWQVWIDGCNTGRHVLDLRL